jgi:hypothetical protein
MRRPEHATALLGGQPPVLERPTQPLGRATRRPADIVEVADDLADRDRLLIGTCRTGAAAANPNRGHEQSIDQLSRLVACLTESQV